MTTTSRTPLDDYSEEIEQLIHDYLRYSGKLIPQTLEEVAAAEEWLSRQSSRLPQSLQSAEACSIHRASVAPRVLPFCIPSTEVSESLARAAREGKTISPEVESQMKRDREQKEREANGGN